MKARITTDPWKINIDNQIEKFYQKYNYTKTNQIKFEIVDNIYERRLELIKNSQKEIEVTNENKENLLKFNGHVVLGYTPNDCITVLFDRKKLLQDNYSWLGTIHHEYTHAHDYLELLHKLGLEKNDEIYNYEYRREYEFWTEFHARTLGSMNVYSNIYKNEIANNDSFCCRNLYEQNCKLLVTSISYLDYYNIAQCLGRHLTIKNLFGSITPSLQSACDNYGVLEELIHLYKYLISHLSFSEVEFDELRNLLICVQTSINQR